MGLVNGGIGTVYLWLLEMLPFVRARDGLAARAAAGSHPRENPAPGAQPGRGGYSPGEDEQSAAA